MTVPIVTLKPKRAQPFFARHPWVFAGAIDARRGRSRRRGRGRSPRRPATSSPAACSTARARSASASTPGTPGRTLDRDFFRERIERAVQLRDALGVRGLRRGCRLVFSEADGLSGCTIDEYAGWLPSSSRRLALAHAREMLADVLQRSWSKPRGIYLRTEKGVGTLEGLELHDGCSRGDPPPADLSIEENGLPFLVNLAEGRRPATTSTSATTAGGGPARAPDASAGRVLLHRRLRAARGQGGSGERRVRRCVRTGSGAWPAQRRAKWPVTGRVRTGRRVQVPRCPGERRNKSMGS